MAPVSEQVFVVIPAYTVSKYIHTCLDSLIQQTYPHWNAFIMDDGSTDNTLKILNEYAGKDKRFNVFSQANSGVAKALNVLLDKLPSETEYIFYLDADDFIHSQTFEILMRYMKHIHPDMVECAIRRVAQDATNVDIEPIDFSALPYQNVEDPKCCLTKSTAVGMWINRVNKLYQWSKIKHIRFAKGLAYEEDYFYACEANAGISTKILIPYALYSYRKNPLSATNLTARFQRYQTCGISRIWLSYEKFLKPNRVPAKYLVAFNRDLTQDAYRMILKKNLKKNRNEGERKELFYRAVKELGDLINRGIIDTKYLRLPERLTLFFCMKRLYFFSRLFVFL